MLQMPCRFCTPAQIARCADRNARPHSAEAAAYPFGTGHAEHLTDAKTPANRRIDAAMKGYGRCLQRLICRHGLLRIWRIGNDARNCRRSRLTKPRISWRLSLQARLSPCARRVTLRQPHKDCRRCGAGARAVSHRPESHPCHSHPCHCPTCRCPTCRCPTCHCPTCHCPTCHCPHLSLRGALATKQSPASGGIASSPALLAMTGGLATPVWVQLL